MRRYDVASGIVTFLGLYQGAVPLVVRPVFGADQRFAPALWLPAPWWWIACLGVVAVAGALLAAIHRARERHVPPVRPVDGATVSPPESTADEDPGADRAAGYDALSGLVLLVGLYNGVAPFVARLVFGGDLLLAFTLRLPTPWWWIASLAVVVLTVVLLAVIDRGKERSGSGGGGRRPPEERNGSGGGGR
ncbi:hypothetical protein SAMN05216574_10334 [Blastococcus tunisiensis]|uniref:Uncharacterized protein n=1 Tax=Blastococcus tunisiensis TaxID=1798228 RepID=A0A1I1ZC54_9ACTN|nr:hypothetical protein SAMN05216574_10334 [Blastococcus sp. DSM 46838]